MVFDRIDFGAVEGVGGGRPDEYGRGRLSAASGSKRKSREEEEMAEWNERKRLKNEARKGPKAPIAVRNPPPELAPINPWINLSWNSEPQAERSIIGMPQRRGRGPSPPRHTPPLPDTPPPTLPFPSSPRISAPPSTTGQSDDCTRGRGRANGNARAVSNEISREAPDLWTRSPDEDRRRNPDIRMSSSSSAAPSGPFTFTMGAQCAQPPARDPPRAPRAMQDHDGLQQSDYLAEIYSLKSELGKAKETIEKLKQPGPLPRTVKGQHAWPLDESKGIQGLRDQCAELELLLEKEKEKSEAERVEHERRLQLKEGHITILKGEMEIAQTDLRLEKERAQAALNKLQNQSPPPQGQLELALSQISKFKTREVKWQADKLLLQGDLSRQQDKIETLQNTADSTASTMKDLQYKIRCQSNQITNLLGAKRAKETEVRQLKERLREQSQRVETNGSRKPSEERQEELGRDEAETRKLRGLLEKAERRLEEETDHHASRERENAEKVERMENQWKAEKEKLESAMREAKNEKEQLSTALDEARGLVAKAQKERDEMKEAWEGEKAKGLEEQMAQINVTENSLKNALETANANYENAKREIEVLKANEQSLRQEFDRQIATKFEELEEGEKQRLQRQTAIQNIKAKLEDAHYEKTRIRRQAEWTDRLNEDLRGQLKEYEGSATYRTKTGKILRT